MGSHPSAGRHCHRRLIVCVLALTLGATLAVAASPALASSKAARQRAKPKITLKLSPSSPRAGRVAKVSGDVWPVEAVGKVVSLAIQRKFRGTWIPVRGIARAQWVRFTPPETWRGSFNMEVQAPPMFPSSTWRGEVVYTLMAKGTSLVQHSAGYELTSATGIFFNDWSYGGVSIQTAWLPPQLQGRLIWYFADSGDIPIDSYEGDAYLTFTGTSIITDSEGHISEEPATGGAGGVIWEAGAYGETKRPLAVFVGGQHGDEIGRMSETRTRYPDDPPDSTSISTWDLSSDAVVNSLLERSGFVKWAYTPTKKGSYRLRAIITGDPTRQHPAGTVWAQSSWLAFTVR
jgi:hypothetical protein